MNLPSLTIVPRTCSAAEAIALARWSAANLPQCQEWAAQRGLRPPASSMHSLRALRFDVSPSLEAPTMPPLAQSSGGEYGELASSETTETTGENSQLIALAADLTRDLGQLQRAIAQAAIQPLDQDGMLTSRTARRFQRVMSRIAHWRVTRLNLTTCEFLIIPLFSIELQTLYVPGWLVAEMPRTLFAPSASFSQPRQTSCIWLLFDAIVLTPTGAFATL